MLQINNLTITHLKDLRTILKNFSFTLNNGDKAVIIGEEGNGKSTLLKLIYNKNLISDYAEFTGEIVKNGIRFGYLAQELTPEQKSKSAAVFFQAIPSFTILTHNELSGIALRLGLDSRIFYSDQTVGTLSGGEKVKLQLAALLMESPDVFLFDEPSNDLDIETLEWLEHFIKTAKQPVIFVSHDETLIENTANVVIHIEQVRRKAMPRWTVARIPYRQYIEERLSRLSHQEQIAKEEQREYEKQQKNFRRIQEKVDHQLNTISRSDPHG
ncbi:MAG TPA: ATP-binding cassette domain-containing protein, partial [Clostridia bacterium]|nr:ATP-binding cassette domain-containing protein [Clostridia bacterium]